MNCYFHRKYIYLVSWTSNNGWEYSSWGIITGESSFAHARAIVNNQSGYVFVTHPDFDLSLPFQKKLDVWIYWMIDWVWTQEVKNTPFIKFLPSWIFFGHELLYDAWKIRFEFPTYPHDISWRISGICIFYTYIFKKSARKMLSRLPIFDPLKKIARTHVLFQA